MNQAIRQHLGQYNESRGFGTGDMDLIELLMDRRRLHSKLHAVRDHYKIYFVVVKINGMLLGFYDAKDTGNKSAMEMGWDFNLGDVCRVAQRKRNGKTQYVRINN